MVKVYVGTENEFYMDGYLKSNIDIAKDVIRKDLDMIFLFDGSEGCLSGDSQIQISRNKLSRRYSIERLYNAYHNNELKLKNYKKWDLSIPNYVRSYNGNEIKLHKIKDVLYSGIKTVYELSLENGYKIKATREHKFLTQDGWKELNKLKQDTFIMCDTLKAEKNNRKRIKLYDIQLPVPKHRFASVKGRVEVHRLIYEARLNNMEFIKYLDVLLNEDCKTLVKLKYINPSIHAIHHKDGCHYNNSIDNLKLMTKEEHLKLHSNNAYSNFSQGCPKWSKVISKKYFGEQKTYDIQCEEPYHNFVANGIIVHNSGKSVLAMQIAFYCDESLTLDRVTFTPDEFKAAVLKAEKYTSVIYDEAYTGLSSRATMSIINRTLIKMLAEIRQKNLFVFVVMPSFFDVDKYVALWRSRALIHIYFGEHFERGYFSFFNSNKKKTLYIFGKKFYNYNKPKANFIGRFTNKYVLDEKKYRDKKRKSLVIDEKSTSERLLRIDLQVQQIERMFAAEASNKLTIDEQCQFLGITKRTYYNKLRDYKTKLRNEKEKRAELAL